MAQYLKVTNEVGRDMMNAADCPTHRLRGLLLKELGLC
jgi:hypothetical protein